MLSSIKFRSDRGPRPKAVAVAPTAQPQPYQQQQQQEQPPASVGSQIATFFALVCLFALYTLC
jgi:hypothetical protein